ncbi:YscO family type III secretion system apparatus protein [Desulfocurvus sp.]|jgi:type III secretion protein O|uniref:type III secretion system stalk subunit SctO n=1 Tax=Desulfocurvus sp. TaxID=2871698 RepID=UPI0025BEF786|nr:YscO family type III secretion system apparatus protein [Desulfocurvus sp.]MCK9239985.1 type III secretion protein [Desulfocurvus sp.]
MSYPLAVLLRVRALRQDKALAALCAAEARLAEARRDLREAKRLHEEFLAWLAGEEERRYEEIMGRDMTLEDVDEFKRGLCAIRGREAAFLERILRARKHVQDCEEALARAKTRLLEAQRATLKIEEHRARWQVLANKEAERREEVELEDFHPAPPQGLGAREAA